MFILVVGESFIIHLLSARCGVITFYVRQVLLHGTHSAENIKCFEIQRCVRFRAKPQFRRNKSCNGLKTIRALYLNSVLVLIMRWFEDCTGTVSELCAGAVHALV